MKLYEQLLQAKSEVDVKDAYIKALGLKSYSKNLIDIQTKEIWFEAKDTPKHSTYAMFTQLPSCLEILSQDFLNVVGLEIKSQDSLCKSKRWHQDLQR